MADKIDMIGKKCNLLTVLKESTDSKVGRGMWVCMCDCGNITIVEGNKLRSNRTKSCGCLSAESARQRFTKHGQIINNKPIPEYSVWSAMIQRCTNCNNAQYYMYGGRGIKVCDRWLLFSNFFEDMGVRPSKNHSLDRYPNNETGNYEKSNCRWATVEQQNRNKRDNVWVTYNNETKIAGDWFSQFKVHKPTAYTMLKEGKSMVEILKSFNKI